MNLIYDLIKDINVASEHENKFKTC